MLGPPAALVLRFARLIPPPRYEMRIQHPYAPVAFSEFSMFCVFWTALPAEPACGASDALRAFNPAPKVQDAHI
jgi:hypothetical protein